MAADRADNRPLVRSAGAIAAGFFAAALITTLVDVVLHATGVFPPWEQRMSEPLFALAAAYRVVFNTAGCFVTARLAPNRPLQHALVIGVVGTVLGTAGAIAMWDKGPPWYSLANIFMALPCAWVGGKLATK
jgi:hypothetical protein